MTFYDMLGRPVAYADDGVHIFLFSGMPVGYLDSGSVWSYAGAHLGRFDDGWIRDNGGDAVFFTDNSSGGPLKPLKQLKPLKGLKQLKPLKSLRQMAPLRPSNTLGWSPLSGSQFFT